MSTELNQSPPHESATPTETTGTTSTTEASPSSTSTQPATSSATSTTTTTTTATSTSTAASTSTSTSTSSSSGTLAASRFLQKHKEKLNLNQYWYSNKTIAAMVAECEKWSSVKNGKAAFLSTPSIFFSLNHKEIKDNALLFDYDDMWAKQKGFVKYNYKEVEKIPSEYYHSCDFVVIDPPFITAEVWCEYAKAAKLLLVPGNEEVEVTHTVAQQYQQFIKLAEEAGQQARNNSDNNANFTGFASNVANILSSVLTTLTQSVQALAVSSTSSSASASSTATEAITSANALVGVSVTRPETHSRVLVPRGKLLCSTIPEHHGFLYELLGLHRGLFRPSIPNLIYQYSLYINYPSELLYQYNEEIDTLEDIQEQLKQNESFKQSAKKKSSINFE